MSKKQKFYVYIGQLRKEFALSDIARKKNKNPDPNKYGLYVGSTSKTPKQRWKEHLNRIPNKKGEKNWSNIAADWGENYIHWKKFQNFNPLKTRSEAEKLEKELAIKFSKNGYATWSDRLPYLKKKEQKQFMEEKLLTEEMLKPYGTTLSIMLDGENAKCVMGPFGTWNDRIIITFENEHPEYGKEFSTKHFEFFEPGVLGWGHDGKTINIKVLDEENSFNETADQHAMD